MDTKRTEQRPVELCLRCMLELEEAGYEAEVVSTGMVICAQCGTRCWGGAYRLSKTQLSRPPAGTAQ